MILLDTSGLYAALNDRQPEHEAARAALLDDDGPLVLSPFVLAELDYLIRRRVGHEIALELLADVGSGRYELAPIDSSDVAEARELILQYRDLAIGLADASLVVLAGRYSTDRILTLDHRDFRVLRTSRGRPFTLLPADAD